MALRLQLDRPDLATRVEQAVRKALDDGYRTPDLMAGEDARIVGTRGMGSAVIERLDG
jgi:3-isopropylmalate dehydrogenase